MSMYIYLLHPLIISNPLVMRAAFSWLSAVSYSLPQPKP